MSQIDKELDFDSIRVMIHHHTENPKEEPMTIMFSGRGDERCILERNGEIQGHVSTRAFWLLQTYEMIDFSRNIYSGFRPTNIYRVKRFGEVKSD